jgi:hypothetical protein
MFYPNYGIETLNEEGDVIEKVEFNTYLDFIRYCIENELHELI